MSTKMELSKEVEKLLNKARTLKLRNEAYLQQSKSQTSSNISSNQLDLDSDMDLEDEDVNEDIIDVNAIDLEDDESWLCKSELSPSKHDDILVWLQKDVEEVKDSRYQGQNIILQYELTRLNNKLDNNIDSRTFTRPKKKMTRPSLESINASFKYSAYKNDDITDSLNVVCNKDTSDLRLSILKNTDTYRKKPSTNDSIYLQDFYKNTKDDTMENIQRISNKIKEVEKNSSFKAISNNLDLSSSLENIIRGQMQKLDVKKPNFHVDELVQNASPPPSLMSTSGFHSSNFTSLTESDFITAECQPQDLFTSYTSTIATDLADDQRDVIQGTDETYSKDIHNLCETISKDINSKIQNTTFITMPEDLDDTLSTEDVSINNITYIESPNYIEKNENLGSGDNKQQNNYETDNLNISSREQNVTVHIPDKQSTKILSETNVISYEKEFVETDTEKSYRGGSGDNTFTKLSASNKISLSDPNLREQKRMCDDSSLNRTFEKSKMQNIRKESSDSLDLNSSFSSINSTRGVDFDYKTTVNGPNKFLFQRRLESTPKTNSKLVKQSWASIETLSPVLHSSPKRETRIVKSAQNIDNTTRIARNALSETKVISCELSEDAQRTFRRLDKTHDVYKTTEDVSSLKEIQQIPTMIVKPMEVKRLAAPATTSTGDLKVNNTITIQPQIKQSMLRQPATRSGLPRPTSGIPRPQSRLPVPRSIKPPSASITKPVIPAKNNWMDGCY